MKEAKAWAPGNVSCVFRVRRGKTPLTSGSSGWGFTVDKGVLAKVKRSRREEIFLNGRRMVFPTVTSVAEALAPEPVRVDLRSELPLGSGFGVSGASALATAYALERLFGLRMTGLELAKAAHAAEVENGTGLGDVINQFYGGICVKFQPSYRFVVSRPGIRARRVHYRIFGKLDTKSVISDQKTWQRLNGEATKAMRKLRKQMRETISLGKMLDVSREFAERSGLMRDARVRKTVTAIVEEGGHATMIMLGNAVVSDRPFPGSNSIMISSRGVR